MESLRFLNVIGNGNDLGKYSGNFCLSPRWKKNVLPIEIYHFYLPPPSPPPPSPHNSLNLGLIAGAKSNGHQGTWTGCKQHWVINTESTEFFQRCFNIVLSTLKQL